MTDLYLPYEFLLTFVIGVLCFVNIVGGLPGDRSALYGERKNIFCRWTCRALGVCMLLFVTSDYFESERTAPLSSFTPWMIPFALLLSAFVTLILYRDATRPAKPRAH